MDELNSTIQTIQNAKNVIGIIVLDKDGNLIESTLNNNEMTLRYADYFYECSWFIQRKLSRNKNLFEKLSAIHIGTKTHDILIKVSDNFVLIIIHKPLDNKIS